MINIGKIEVDNRYGSEFLVVRWTLSSTFESADDYIFSVYRSNSPASGYVKIANNVEGLEYVDREVNLQNSSIRYYYKIEIADSSGEDAVMSAATGDITTVDPDPVADTVIYLNNTLLDYLTKGKDNAFVLLRKRTGPKCPVCWDPVRKSVSKSNCTSCYGVGIVGGYHEPISTKINIGEPARGMDFSESGFKEMVAPVQAWTTNYPVIHPEDILVDDLNRRYVVKSWQPTMKDGVIITRQIMEVQEIPHTNVIYKLPMPSDPTPTEEGI